MIPALNLENEKGGGEVVCDREDGLWYFILFSQLNDGRYGSARLWGSCFAKFHTALWYNLV